MDGNQSGFEIIKRPLGVGLVAEGDYGNVRRVGKTPDEVRRLLRDALAKILGYPEFDAIPPFGLEWLANNIDAANLFQPSGDRL